MPNLKSLLTMIKSWKKIMFILHYTKIKNSEKPFLPKIKPKVLTVLNLIKISIITILILIIPIIN
jgi:hypothetical protein